MAHVTEQEVHQACERIDEAGNKTTAERVRQELGGRGSYTTIRKHILSWEKDLSTADVPAQPGAFAQTVAESAARLWIVAYRCASIVAAEACTKLEAEAVKAEADRQELGEFNAMLESELESAQMKIEALSARLADAEQKNADFDAALRECKAKNIVLRGQLDVHEDFLRRFEVPTQSSHPEPSGSASSSD